MKTLPKSIVACLIPFVIIFHAKKTFLKMTLFLIGVLLCKGGRTVCGSLRELGLQGERAFSNFHHLLNRCRWSGLQSAKVLFRQLLPLAGDQIRLIVDEHLERRNGEKIRAKGLYRDAVASSKSWVIKSWGLKWVVLSVLISFPWSKRPFALPFFCVLRKPQHFNTKRKHRTGIDLTCQMLKAMRRWFPHVDLVIIGDGDYGRVKLAEVCDCLSIQLISRLRIDARLHAFPEKSSYRGRPVKLGQRILRLRKQDWKEDKIRGYGGKKQKVNWASQKCLWYAGKPEKIIPILAIWVKLRKQDQILLISTNLEANTLQAIEAYVRRWNLEVTFRECREHLGVQTQRQWSDLSIERTTPLLFCLYSLVTLMSHVLYQQKGIKPESTAWYKKRYLTFSDLLSAVRKELGKCRLTLNSSPLQEFDKKDYCDLFPFLKKLDISF